MTDKLELLALRKEVFLIAERLRELKRRRNFHWYATAVKIIDGEDDLLQFLKSCGLIVEYACPVTTMIVKSYEL